VQDNPVTDSNIQKWISIILKQTNQEGKVEGAVNTPGNDGRRTEVLPTFGGATNTAGTR